MAVSKRVPFKRDFFENIEHLRDKKFFIIYSEQSLDRTWEQCYSTKRINPSVLLGFRKRTKEGDFLKISTKGRYGLRALIDVAQHSEVEPVSISGIASRQDISERYLEQLMALLKKAGLIKSIRGAGGGYVLAKPMEEISVGDVLRALEGNLEPVECAGFQEQDSCKAAGGCVTKYVWQRINDSINRTVDEINVRQLVEESRRVQPDVGAPKKCNG